MDYNTEVRRCALDMAIGLLHSGKIDNGQLIDYARKFENYLLGHNPPVAKAA